MRVALLKIVAAAALLAAGLSLTLVGRNQRGEWEQPAFSQGGPPRILQFYASTGTVQPGERAEICYGVANVKSVRISPMFLPFPPAAKRCLTVFPRHTTHYTLLAEGFDGSVRMQSVTLAVQMPVPAPEQPVQMAVFGLQPAAGFCGAASPGRRRL
jgi:hypothetical protein